MWPLILIVLAFRRAVALVGTRTSTAGLGQPGCRCNCRTRRPSLLQSSTRQQFRSQAVQLLLEHWLCCFFDLLDRKQSWFKRLPCAELLTSAAVRAMASWFQRTKETLFSVNGITISCLTLGHRSRRGVQSEVGGSHLFHQCLVSISSASNSNMLQDHLLLHLGL